VQDPRVTYALFGTVAAAVLTRFARGVNRFALWLRGPTGAGKTFAAQLAQNFYGAFPIGVTVENQVASWTATPNALQVIGYYFKDALYLIDDFKFESCNPRDVVRFVQNYADGTARSRLNADATLNTTRPVRGFVVATGEDIPEHAASVTARLIVIDVPERTPAQKGLRAAELAHGRRCLAECGHYPGVTLDFVRWLLAAGRLPGFPDRVAARQQFYHEKIAG
jgi:uncharacterized protein (DUF927 family)